MARNYTNRESLDSLPFQKEHIEKELFYKSVELEMFYMIETLENRKKNYFEFVKSIFIIFNFTLKHCTKILILNLI